MQFSRNLLVVPAILAIICGVSGAAEPPRFNRDVRPILSTKCFACHGPDANHREADLRLDVRDAAVESAIVPGQPAQSELVARITSSDPDLRMPPPASRHSLSPAEVETLTTWISNGAEYESHWALIPPRRPTVPAAPDAGQPQTVIDRFVARRLAEQSLAFAPRATPAELLRRVSLDLTGLPPTLNEIEAFEADPSQAAYERHVDRLLASDRYGEHMARFWLDAARYADTNGYQYDLEREQWVWRDWVIHAFNSNMPFDQFTIEQLAGDLLPDATEQQKLATAFHRNHPITIEGGVIDEEYRTEYVIDRVVTTSTVWMGTTMMCGRCHDHKYDPFSQRDFYQLFAFFNQVPERGLNGFDPRIKVASPLQAQEIEALDRRLVEARSAFQELALRNEDKIRQRSEQLQADLRDQWAITVPDQRVSDGGAQLTVLPDSSILASGPNPAYERYELTMPLTQTVYAIRLEALAHESFVNQSTGRGSNGNFVLSEFQVSTADDGSAKFESQKIASATADYSQKSYGIELSIDGRIDNTGWAVDGNTRFEDRTAVYTLARPIEPQPAARLRIELHHRYGGSHHIGRFRISLATRPVSSVPADIESIAALPAAQRSKDQQSALVEYLFRTSGSTELEQAVARLESLRDARAQLAEVPATMVMADRADARVTHVLMRGEYDKPGDVVQPDTPGALPSFPAGSPRNRLGLARWLVDPGHPLTARVAVNRLWYQVFGTGLVETVEDFGSQGAWPSHPELLDWLAVEFVESGWDIQHMLKLMVTSRAYQQSSVIDAERVKLDPANRLLSRGPRMRLDAEVIRDSALAVSGLLDQRVGGPSVFPYHPVGLWQEINNRPGYSRTYRQDSGSNLYRRSLYTFWKRTVPPPAMATFDAPEREYCVVRRSRTNTPLQAIVLMHDPQFVEAARHLGGRMMNAEVSTDRERLIHGFRLCCSRRPADAELVVLERLLADGRQRFGQQKEAALKLLSVGETKIPDDADVSELAAWTSIGRVLLNLSEFVTKG